MSAVEEKKVGVSLLKAFNELAVENALDRAALLAHGFKYELEDFVRYARQTWHSTKHDLQARAKTFDVEPESALSRTVDAVSPRVADAVDAVSSRFTDAVDAASSRVAGAEEP